MTDVRCQMTPRHAAEADVFVPYLPTSTLQAPERAQRGERAAAKIKMCDVFPIFERPTLRYSELTKQAFVVVHVWYRR